MSGVLLVAGGPDPVKVMEDTWGSGAHPGTRYRMTFLFTHGWFGDRTVIDMDYSDRLDGGPWLYYDVHDWLNDQPTEEGKVYRFTGTYRATKDHESYAFDGRVEELKMQ